MHSLPAKKILLAVLSGLLITASFPPLKTDWLVWVSIIPLLLALEGTSPGEAFRVGIIAGLSHYVSLIYWIVNVISTYGGLHLFISICVLFLLCMYLSIYPGIFSFFAVTFKGSKIKILFFAGMWVSLEYIRGQVFTGFPWGFLGYSQYSRLEIAQIADITGVYGLSFIIVAFNVLLFNLIVKNKEIFKDRYFISETLILIIVTCTSIHYGNTCLTRYSAEKQENPQINIAVIQGNIDQTSKWNEEFQEKTIDKYINLTQSSYNTNPDVIVWPETAVPFFFQDESPLTEKIFNLASQSNAHLVFGSPAYRIESGNVLYYNSAWCVSPEGIISGQYNKSHLVPFGEYVPLQKFLPFVHRLVPAAGDFSKGESFDPLLPDKLPSGILICYEIIFPEIARSQVLKGAGMLINITNDAWFGHSSAPYQHLYISVFRAIETRRPLVRSANTGISAIIDSAGRVKIQGDLFTDEVITGRVTPGKDTLSIYSRFGDVFAAGILILCLIKISIGLSYSRKKRKK